MNKYNDIFLDDQGVESLDKIILLSNKNPVEALDRIDNLIRLYPKSPQLWVSKSIIMPSKYNEERIEHCKTAIGLDQQFFDGYYYLAKNQMLGTTIYCSCGNASERLEVSLQFMNWVKAFSNNPTAGLAELNFNSHHYFIENWVEWYEAAIKNEAHGIVNMDQNRYTQEEINKFIQKHIMYRDADASTKKFLIMRILAQSLGISLD